MCYMSNLTKVGSRPYVKGTPMCHNGRIAVYFGMVQHLPQGCMLRRRWCDCPRSRESLSVRVSELINTSERFRVISKNRNLQASPRVQEGTLRFPSPHQVNIPFLSLPRLVRSVCSPVHQFSLADTRHHRNIHLHREQVRDVKFSVDGGSVGYILSTSFDKTVKVGDPRAVSHAFGSPLNVAEAMVAFLLHANAKARSCFTSSTGFSDDGLLGSGRQMR